MADSSQPLVILPKNLAQTADGAPTTRKEQHVSLVILRAVGAWAEAHWTAFVAQWARAGADGVADWLQQQVLATVPELRCVEGYTWHLELFGEGPESGLHVLDVSVLLHEPESPRDFS